MQMMTVCKSCGGVDELRYGFCFDCASRGEVRAAKRTVLQHFAQCLHHFGAGCLSEARIDFKWAWERLTRTGDYRKDGYFDGQQIDWRAR